MLNSHLTLQWARNFADRVQRLAGTDPARQIETAFRIAYGRAPDAAEQRMAREFLTSQGTLLAAATNSRGLSARGDHNANAAAKPPGTGETSPPQSSDRSALEDLCHTLINANEFVYVN